MSKGISTKEKIVREAAALFNTYGYHGCSLSHIMEATQLQKGGIYNHFKNKDEIAIASFDYSYKEVIRRFREKLDLVTSPDEKLFVLIDVYASFAKDPVVKGGGCPIMNAAVDATNMHPELKKRARQGVQGLKKYIEIKLQEGIDQGLFKAIDKNAVSSLLMSTLEGAIMMASVNGTYDSVDIAVGFIKDYIKQQVLKGVEV